MRVGPLYLGASEVDLFGTGVGPHGVDHFGRLQHLGLEALTGHVSRPRDMLCLSSNLSNQKTVKTRYF